MIAHRSRLVAMASGIAAAAILIPTSDLHAGAAPHATAAPGTWTAEETLIDARSSHTATLLTGPACRVARPPSYCGKVLVTGGDGGSMGLLSTAEIHDPATGHRYPVGGTFLDLVYHTATLLADGRVLVVGGDGGVTLAQIFDPSTGAWTRTAPMHDARSEHTATLLWRSDCDSSHAPRFCGDVLVAGGIEGGYGSPWWLIARQAQTLSSAEIFDPRTGTWTSAGDMADTRAGHTATLLEDGRVLVAGGYGISTSLVAQTVRQTAYVATPLASAELYDPVTGRWSATGSMAAARGAHTASLLTGAACSGSDRSSYCGTVLVAGGTVDGETSLAGAEVFDPSSGAWSSAGAMTVPRYAHTATVLHDGRVLVTGGYTPATADPQGPWAGVLVTSRGAEIYDPAATGSSAPLMGGAMGTWTAIASMRDGRAAHTASLLDGSTECVPSPAASACDEVFVAGGQGEGFVTTDTRSTSDTATQSLSSTELYRLPAVTPSSTTAAGVAAPGFEHRSRNGVRPWRAF